MAGMLNQESILEVCATLSETENLKVTLNEASKGALVVGFCTFVGALLGGPVGLAVGGTVSSVGLACTGKSYKSVVDVLRNDLSLVQKQQLIHGVSRILNNITVQDFSKLLTLVISSAHLKEAIINEISRFLLNEFSYKLMK